MTSFVFDALNDESKVYIDDVLGDCRWIFFPTHNAPTLKSGLLSTLYFDFFYILIPPARQQCSHRYFGYGLSAVPSVCLTRHLNVRNATG